MEKQSNQIRFASIDTRVRERDSCRLIREREKSLEFVNCIDLKNRVDLISVVVFRKLNRDNQELQQPPDDAIISTLSGKDN